VQGSASGFLPTPPHDDAVASGSELAPPLPPGDFHPPSIAHAGRTQKRRLRRRWPGEGAGPHPQNAHIKTARTSHSPVQGVAVFLARNCPAHGYRLKGALQAVAVRSATPFDPASTHKDLGTCEEEGRTRFPLIGLSAPVRPPLPDVRGRLGRRRRSDHCRPAQWWNQRQRA
jgi:hypothetical protein